MKKRKIVCIVLCMVMIVTVLPVVGLPIQPGELQPLTRNQLPYKPPGPGEAAIPSYNLTMDTSITHPYHEKPIATMDDIVISMIEQVDESIYLSYLENLTSFGPRRTGTSACIAAAEYIYTQFQDMGLAVRYHHWTNGGYTSDNVEATINGTDESSDDIYIVCGHYDTVTGSPGADDDGSGTVAVMIAAYVMSQYRFNHTIKFVTFSGEEQGLLGSEIYAQQAAAQGWDIIGVLNCDMISYAITTSDGNNLIVYENTASEWLYTHTFEVNSEYSDYIQLTLHHGGSTWGSDHNSFWDEGFDALFYFEYEMTPYYHGPGDTIEHINATYAVKNVRLVLATLAELAEAGLLSNPPAQPSTPVGKTLVVWNRTYSYTSTTIDPDEDQIFYRFDWGDGSNSGWVGPYNSGQTGTATHAWTQLGTYAVQVKARDIWGAESPLSDVLTVVVTDNTPPFDPTIDGPTQIKPKVAQTFTVSSIDEFDQNVYFDIDWGDGSGDSGIGPYNSGEEVELTHTWTKKGTYKIKVLATDEFGMESNWTYLEIVCPIDYSYSINGLLQHLFQLFPRLFPILRQLMGY